MEDKILELLNIPEVRDLAIKKMAESLNMLDVKEIAATIQEQAILIAEEIIRGCVESEGLYEIADEILASSIRAAMGGLSFTVRIEPVGLLEKENPS